MSAKHNTARNNDSHDLQKNRPQNITPLWNQWAAKKNLSAKHNTPLQVMTGQKTQAVMQWLSRPTLHATAWGQFCSLSSSQSILGKTWLHSLRIGVAMCRKGEQRIKAKRIFRIWYLHCPEWLRKPDGSKLSQRHFLKAISILCYAVF
mgnify:CR=1 FL=1